MKTSNKKKETKRKPSEKNEKNGKIARKNLKINSKDENKKKINLFKQFSYKNNESNKWLSDFLKVKNSKIENNIFNLKNKNFKSSNLKKEKIGTKYIEKKAEIFKK